MLAAIAGSAINLAADVERLWRGKLHRGTSEGKEVFFFEKKNQKTFANCGEPPCRRM
jgi:hypothetical protein